MAEFNIKRLVSGGIITNYFCTSKCRHCLYNCGPHWEKKYIERATAEDILRLVRSMGCKSVHVGGGEPLLRPDMLTEVLEVAGHVGVSIEYVETNSSWFKDLESAKNTLFKLRSKGLKTLLVSISPFHNEYIPFSRIRGVIEACRNTGINVFPWVNGFIRDLTEFNINKTHSFEEFEEKFGKDYLLRVLQRYWIHMGGRALDTYRPVLTNKSPQQVIDENSGGCARELSDTSHFHIDLFGNYIPGLCSGLSIATKDLGKPLSEKEYPVISMLVNSGIKGIYELACKDFAYTPAKSGYINKCDLCTEIRAFLVHNNFGGLFEFEPRGFYLKLA
jgi:uncharacterized Fe-S cluster-containing radical SAM superfamily protein